MDINTKSTLPRWRSTVARLRQLRPGEEGLIPQNHGQINTQLNPRPGCQEAASMGPNYPLALTNSYGVPRSHHTKTFIAVAFITRCQLRTASSAQSRLQRRVVIVLLTMLYSLAAFRVRNNRIATDAAVGNGIRVLHVFVRDGIGVATVLLALFVFLMRNPRTVINVTIITGDRNTVRQQA
ncbi:hypothetical protein F5Y19DRAFT_470730 [Xylariaceae sp. FL1651]|nr:hypothetical protein F5Y19DRAFT_470730 [Xylariaceae sp. FL1651]